MTTLLLVLGWLSVATISSSPAVETPQLISSDGETAPVFHSGDAMDDPAVWVHPTDPSQSLVMGNDKGGGLETYDLDGQLVQRLEFGTQFWGNVDVRQGATVGTTTRDLVGVVQRGVRFYTVDPATRLLSPVTEDALPIGSNGEGFCMYVSPTTQKVYGISITIAGLVQQFELLDADDDGLLESQSVRTFSVGSEAEGCVADDDTGALYISEENVALWRYDAEPSGGTVREAVDVLTSQGGHLVNDIEGVTIVDQADGGGFVIVSVQNSPDPHASYLSVYRRGVGNDFVKTFRVADGTASDDCDRTDGVTAVTADLGPAFPRGVFVCQDNNNDPPGTTGNQDLKLVQLDRVVNLDGGEEPPPPPPPPPPPSVDIGFVGQASTNTNSTAFTVNVPTSTQPDDTLLLFAAQGGTTPLSGPGPGWTQIGRVTDSTHATTIWHRIATATDPGTQVRLTATSFTKVGLTIAAYHGTDPTDPILAISGAPEPGNGTTHTTPVATNTNPGAWRLSYWSLKTSATTTWTPPAGETTRAATTGTGGGRITTLLTDPDTPVPTGPQGTLTATATTPTDKATTWTLLLRPAGG